MWSGWKSPIGLGFFFITTSLAAAIALYTLLNFFVSVGQVLHPQPQSQGMSQQELQQLEQQAAPTSDGSTGAAQ